MADVAQRPQREGRYGGWEAVIAAMMLPLMNEAKKPPNSEGDGVHTAASPNSSSWTRSRRQSTR